MPLTPEELEQIQEITRQAVDDGFTAFRQGFFIEPERHFKEHEFLCTFKDNTERIGRITLQIIIGAIVMSILGMIGLGFLHKVKGG